MLNSLGFKPSDIANDSPCGVSDTAPRSVNVLKFKVGSTLSTKTSVNPNRPTGTCWNSLQLTIPEGTWSTNELVTQIPSKDCNCWSKNSFPHIKLHAFHKSAFRSLRLVWILSGEIISRKMPSTGSKFLYWMFIGIPPSNVRQQISLSSNDPGDVHWRSQPSERCLSNWIMFCSFN